MSEQANCRLVALSGNTGRSGDGRERDRLNARLNAAYNQERWTRGLSGSARPAFRASGLVDLVPVAEGCHRCRLLESRYRREFSGAARRAVGVAASGSLTAVVVGGVAAAI